MSVICGEWERRDTLVWCGQIGSMKFSKVYSQLTAQPDAGLAQDAEWILLIPPEASGSWGPWTYRQP